jgi:hypothetical protein
VHAEGGGHAELRLVLGMPGGMSRPCRTPPTAPVLDAGNSFAASNRASHSWSMAPLAMAPLGCPALCGKWEMGEGICKWRWCATGVGQLTCE